MNKFLISDMAETEAVVASLQRLGLAEVKAKETTKNKALTSSLMKLLEMAGSRDLAGARGNLLYQVASKAKPQMWPLVPIIVDYICEDKIDSDLRLAAAVDFLLKLPPGTKQEEVELAKLDEVAGVGVVISPEQVEEAVEKAIAAAKADILANRWRFNPGPLMGKVRGQLKWADGKEIKAQVEIQLLDLLGPKTDADLLPPPKAEKKKGDKKGGNKEEKKAGAGKEEETEEGAATIAELMKTKV